MFFSSFHLNLDAKLLIQVRACRDSDGEFYVYRLPQQERLVVLDDDHADCNDNDDRCDHNDNGDNDVLTVPQQEGGCHWAYCATTETEVQLYQPT